MKKGKWLCVFLAFLVCAGAAGCSPKPEAPAVNERSEDIYDVNSGVDLTGPTMEIVGKAGSEYEILLRDDFSKPEDFAAKELAGFIEQATGVRLVVTTDALRRKGGKVISIGFTQALQEEVGTFDYSALNSDGFFIKTVGPNVYINGENERSRIYGVYEFLERFVGIRFLTPQYTHVPELESLNIHRLDILEVPEFRQRNFYNGTIFTDSLFQVRMRMFSDLAYPNETYGYQSEWCRAFKSDMHNAIEYVPVEIYGESHPEFYSWKTNPGTEYRELCYTNGITEDGKIDQSMSVSVAKVLLDSLKNYAREWPNAKFFMIGKSDERTAFCKCDVCRRREEAYGGKSGTMCIFMNAIAREISAWARQELNGREINIVFFAYQFTEEAPVKTVNGELVPANEMVKLEPNVYVRIAPISANYGVGFADERQQEFYRKVFDGWSRVTENLMVWDYTTNYNEYLWYMPNLNYMQSNLRFYKDIGTVYVMNQSSYDTRGDWQSDLKLYLASKLYWHINYDVNALIEEYIRLQYGVSAASDVLAFIWMMEEHFAAKVGNGMEIATLPSLHEEYMKPETYPLRLLEKGMDSIRNAMEKTRADENLSLAERERYLRNLTGVLLTPQRMILKNYSAYYLEGKREFAADFYANCSTYGMSRVAEYVPIEKDKVNMGVA